MKKRILSLALLLVMGLGIPLVAFAADAEHTASLKTTASLNAESAVRAANGTAAVTQESPQSDQQIGAASENLTINPESGYRIIPGDVLQIDVWKEEGLNQEVLVLPDGMITFPLAGSFSVAGMTLEHVQAMLKEKLKALIPDATVTVSVKAALGHTVSVIGQVTKPGEFIMGHGLTVMQALSQAGGLTPYADEGSVIVLRRTDGKEESIPFPYDDVARGKNLDQDIVLAPGDVVVVPTTSLF